MSKEIMKQEPTLKPMTGKERGLTISHEDFQDALRDSENAGMNIDYAALARGEYADTDSISSYPKVSVNLPKKQEINAKFGTEVTKRMSPKKAAYEGGGTSPLLLDFLQKNPEIFLRKSSFDGMGEPFTSDDLDGEKAFLYECEILDYDAVNKDTGEAEHYHYSVWLGVRDSDNRAFVYSAGKQLTELAESLILLENSAVKKDVSEKGIHVIFNMIKLKSDPRKSFMKVDVIP